MLCVAWGSVQLSVARAYHLLAHLQLVYLKISCDVFQCRFSPKPQDNSLTVAVAPCCQTVVTMHRPLVHKIFPDTFKQSKQATFPTKPTSRRMAWLN